MKINLLSSLLLLCCFSCNEAVDKKESKDVKSNPIQLSMQKHVDSLLLDSKISAVSIGIYKDGEEYIGHYGELDDGKNNKPDNNTIYEIASVSKTFAGTLAAQAELDGKLSLEDDIRKYFEEEYKNLEYQGHPIKVKHLLTHTSRLPKFLPDHLNDLFTNIDENLPFKIYDIQKEYNKEKFYADLKRVQLDTIPGTKYDYSNVDTEILAHILEKIYEKEYEALLKQYVFDRAGMPNTKITLSKNEKTNLANGYGETRKIVPHMANTTWGADGGVKSTIPDMINYMKFQLDTTDVVVKKSHQILYQIDDRSIAYYWPNDTDEKYGTYYGHHGGAMGTQNWLLIFPKYQLGFSIITNQSDQATAGKLIETAFDILDELELIKK